MKPSKNGVGSNQYVTKPGAPTTRLSPEERAQIEWAFTHDGVDNLSPDDLNVDSPRWLLEWASTSTSRDVRGAVAELTDDAQLLRRLADDPEALVRVGVAANPLCPPDILERLGSPATEKNAFVRREVASNPCASASLLEKMSGDGYWEVVRNVAGHPTTTTAVLLQVVERDNVAVTYAAMKNPNLPPNTIRHLVNVTSDSDVGWANAAHNPSTPADVLHRLIDPDVWIGRKGSAIVPNAQEQIAWSVACHPNTTIEDLRKLAASDFTEAATAATLRLDTSEAT